MNDAITGIVGRFVMARVKRGEVVTEEPCEVMACQTGGDFGSWRVLVATTEGTLLTMATDGLRLVARPDSQAGPYR